MSKPRRSAGEITATLKAIAASAETPSERAIAMGRVVARKDSALAARVAAGELTLNQAYVEATGEKPPRRKRIRRTDTRRARVKAVASAMQVSERRLWMTIYVADASPEISALVRNGAVSLDRAYKFLKGKKLRESAFERLERVFLQVPHEVRLAFPMQFLAIYCEVCAELDREEETTAA